MLSFQGLGSADIQEQAQQTYRDLDERITERKEREIRNTKHFWQDIITGVNTTEESLFDDPHTGRLEKRRLRIISLFERQILQMRTKLQEANDQHFLNQDP